MSENAKIFNFILVFFFVSFLNLFMFLILKTSFNKVVLKFQIEFV